MKSRMNTTVKKILIPALMATVMVTMGVLTWISMQPKELGEEFASGNGRIEATEIDVSTKLSGRVVDIFVNEGDLVESGQIVAQMQIDVLNAQLDEAHAQQQQAINAVANAEAQVAVRESDLAAAQAVVVQRESELDNAKRRLARSDILSREKAVSIQQFDDDRADVRNAEASLTASKAQVSAALAAIKAAKAQVAGARSAVMVANATIARIEVDIADNQLKAPRDGRVQYRVAQPGEVVAAGGKVLNMVDLSDVYMTFFLPTATAGQIAIGSEVRLVLDAAPDYVIPAQVSFVSDVAQFTPKTVETASERQKLMFRIKAKIPPYLLRKHIRQVKTGLPGMAYVRLDPQLEWPQHLQIRLPQ